MKRFFAWLISLGSLSFSSLAVASADVDRDLLQLLQSDRDRQVRVIALLELGQHEVFPARYDSRDVILFLKARANRDTRLVESHLQKTASSRGLRIVGRHWINNSLVADINLDGLQALASAPGVERIYLNRKIQLDRPTQGRILGSARAIPTDSWTYNFKDISLDRLASEQPKIDGTGVVLGSVDTGVDATHAALRGKVVGFFDAAKNQVTEPFDFQQHGTHTIGTMIGGDRDQMRIGVAPGAKVIATAALTGYDAMIRGMEFMADPDRNPNTSDFPRVINNSWNSGGAPDQEMFYRAIAAWEAIGILPVFSAGNAGPRPQTITAPKEHPASFAVAATGPGGKVTGFSSRGPAVFRGQRVAKPEVSAPGQDIVSAIPGDRLGALSGTSMAAPHVAGVAALMLQVNPNLNPAQLRELLVKSSMFVDINGNSLPNQIWNQAYGYGRLNAFAAVTLAARTRGEAARRRSSGQAGPLLTFSPATSSRFTQPSERLIPTALSF